MCAASTFLERAQAFFAFDGFSIHPYTIVYLSAILPYCQFRFSLVLGSPTCQPEIRRRYLPTIHVYYHLPSSF
jgi:hypothetical protein